MDSNLPCSIISLDSNTLEKWRIELELNDNNDNNDNNENNENNSLSYYRCVNIDDGSIIHLWKKDIKTLRNNNSKKIFKYKEPHIKENIIELYTKGIYDNDISLTESHIIIIKEYLVDCDVFKLIDILKLYSETSELFEYITNLLVNHIKSYYKKDIIYLQKIQEGYNKIDKPISKINNTLKKYIKSCNNKIANVETDIIDSAYFEKLSKILECFKSESSEYKSYIDEMVQGDEYYWVTSAGFKDWFDASRFDNFQIY